MLSSNVEAHSSSGLGHRPLKAEIRGSNPLCATTRPTSISESGNRECVSFLDVPVQPLRPIWGVWSSHFVTTRQPDLAAAEVDCVSRAMRDERIEFEKQRRRRCQQSLKRWMILWKRCGA
jgi:hypothetical protein